MAGLFLGLALPLHAERIVGAHYAAPVERYGHFALGRPHEYARVVARTDSGRDLALDLPADEVFEDLAPRLVPMAADSPPMLLAIVSSVHDGAGLALLGLADGHLTLLARSVSIGTPHRWLNPVAAVDLDGDGVVEIAAVTTPHIGGVLRIYRQQGARLIETASLAGFSNHVYGSAELRLSGAARIAGQTQLLVPDARRASLRAIRFKNGRLAETARCPLAVPITAREALVRCAETLAADMLRNADLPPGSAPN